MDSFKKLWEGAVSHYVPVGVTGVVLSVVGIILISSTYPSSHEDKACLNQTIITIDYTHCILESIYENETRTCRDVIQKSTRTCKCFVDFNISTDITGDVALYYVLETFNQSDVAKQANYFQSRDDNQLKGELSTNVSEACGNYSYDTNGKPIAPCGALANTMFNDDEFLLIPQQLRAPLVPQTLAGLIPEEHKARFRNPEPRDDLRIAFQNFSKPINWDFNIWELDTLNRTQSNNGFENMMFIGWMTPEWKRKPVWRLDRTRYEEFENGLPAGPYSLKIEYRYPVSRYDGPRKVVLAKPMSFSDEPECTTIIIEDSSALYIIGIITLLFGVIFGLFAGITILKNKKTIKQKGASRRPSNEAQNVTLQEEHTN